MDSLIPFQTAVDTSSSMYFVPRRGVEVYGETNDSKRFVWFGMKTRCCDTPNEGEVTDGDGIRVISRPCTARWNTASGWDKTRLPDFQVSTQTSQGPSGFRDMMEAINRSLRDAFLSGGQMTAGTELGSSCYMPLGFGDSPSIALAGKKGKDAMWVSGQSVRVDCTCPTWPFQSVHVIPTLHESLPSAGTELKNPRKLLSNYLVLSIPKQGIKEADPEGGKGRWLVHSLQDALSQLPKTCEGEGSVSAHQVNNEIDIFDRITTHFKVQQQLVKETIHKWAEKQEEYRKELAKREIEWFRPVSEQRWQGPVGCTVTEGDTGDIGLFHVCREGSC